MNNTTQLVLTNKDYKRYFEKGISYEAYKNNFQKEIDMGEEIKYAKYLPQNWSRQSRLDRKFQLSDELKVAIQQLDKPLNWLVITEHWCGDASQINPIINKVAEESQGKINLRFVYRDEHNLLMHAHLTDGKSRSIPILIQMNEDFKLMNSYGPRPADAQKLALSLIAKGESYDVPLHTWYARDKQVSLQQDIAALINQ